MAKLPQAFYRGNTGLLMAYRQVKNESNKSFGRQTLCYITNFQYQKVFFLKHYGSHSSGRGVSFSCLRILNVVVFSL